MRRPWLLKNVMASVAILAIYLAAFRFITRGPSDQPSTVWTQCIAIVVLFFVMPFHVTSAWTRLTAGQAGKWGDL
jgi:hypothetical protein